MLKIRLKRGGRKKQAFYKIIVIENLSKREGKSLCDIGFYDPIKKKISFNIMLLYKYLNLGARPTHTVRHLIYKSL